MNLSLLCHITVLCSSITFHQFVCECNLVPFFTWEANREYICNADEMTTTAYIYKVGLMCGLEEKRNQVKKPVWYMALLPTLINFTSHFMPAAVVENCATTTPEMKKGAHCMLLQKSNGAMHISRDMSPSLEVFFWQWRDPLASRFFSRPSTQYWSCYELQFIYAGRKWATKPEKDSVACRFAANMVAMHPCHHHYFLGFSLTREELVAAYPAQYCVQLLPAHSMLLQNILLQPKWKAPSCRFAYSVHSCLSPPRQNEKFWQQVIESFCLTRYFGLCISKM